MLDDTVTTCDNGLRWAAVGLGAGGVGLTVTVALSLLGWVFLTRRRSLRTAHQAPPYELQEKLGEGTTAVVYRAIHTRLDRPTAIKIARAGLPAQLFVREVQLQASLSHPNTAIVYDFGDWPDGRLYCALELIDGFDLASLVRLTGPLPSGRVARILGQLAAALVEAHGKHFVHQDIKPENVMLTERGGVLDFVKVLDFGLARTRQGEGGANHLSNPSGVLSFVGTLGFAAPEIASGAVGTPSSDIFSLGAVGFFLLMGKGPFEEQRSRPILSLSLEQRTQLLEPARAHELARLVAQCLSRDPTDRPFSMKAIVDHLRELQVTLPRWTALDAERWWAEHELLLRPKSPKEQPQT